MQEREKIHAELEAKLSGIKETINELRIKTEEQPSRVDRTGAPSLEDLQARHTAAENKLEMLSQIGQQNWARHKSDLDRYLEDIDEGLRTALALYH